MLLLLFAAAMLLRCWRLDLMSFRYDSAEAAFRARETLKLWHPPWTGIVNSLGFRNPAGFIWLILPPMLISPDPRPAAAWISLLSLTALWPIFCMCKRRGGGWLFPCVIYAFLPASVFWGRAIWAQNVLAAFGAWALWFVMIALDSGASPRRRRLAGTGAMAVLAFAVTIHIAVLPLLVVAAVLLAWAVRRRNLPAGTLAHAGGVFILLAAALAPSAADWLHERTHPSPKPDFVVKFESMLPPRPGLGRRFSSAAAGVFEPFFSLGATGGIDQQISETTAVVARAADLFLIVLSAAGIGLAAIRFRRGQNRLETGILLLWVGVPVVVAPFAVTWVNGTYLLAGFPAVLLVAGALLDSMLRHRSPQSEDRSTDQQPRPWISGALCLVLAIIYTGFILDCIRCVDRSRYVNGPYYIPLADLEAVASKLSEGIAPGEMEHFSGGWFQRPYAYLHREVFDARQLPRGASPGSFAVIGDLNLMHNIPHGAALMSQKAAFAVGPVRGCLLPSKADAHRFMAQMASAADAR